MIFVKILAPPNPNPNPNPNLKGDAIGLFSTNVNLSLINPIDSLPLKQTKV